MGDTEISQVPASQLTLMEKLLYSTTRIRPTLDGFETGSSGTGFVFVFGNEEKIIPAIITNKHVLLNANGLRAYFHMANGASAPKDYTEVQLDFSECPVIPHPNANTDLAAVLTGPALNKLGLSDKVLLVGLTLAMTPTDWSQFDALEELLMVGCPRGIWDEHSKLPVFRHGYSATPISRRYDNQEQFLIDMACYPGSSGSPVFIYNPNGYRNPREHIMTFNPRFYFVGVLFAGPLIENTGNIILGQAPRVVTESMMHLGQVIRSTEIGAIQRIILDSL